MFAVFVFITHVNVLRVSCTLTGDRAVLPADAGGTHLAGAQTGKAALRAKLKDIRAGAVHRQPACARHGGAAEYSHVHELHEEVYLGGFTAGTLFLV